MGLTPETLADLRKKAEAAKDIDPANYYPGQTPSEYVAHTKAATPAVVVALLDRIAELEVYREVAQWVESSLYLDDAPDGLLERSRAQLTKDAAK